jgi:Predicted protease with the C-terminal PDZ domain
MRTLWRRYGATGEPAPEGALEAVATELSGLDLRAFFDAALRGTGSLPLAESLAAFGVHAERRPAHGADDVGGRSGGAPPPVDFGLRFAAGGLRLAHVLHGGAAEHAGLQPDDELVALDGERLRAAQWARRLEALRPDQTVGVAYFRDDRLLHTELRCAPPPADTWTLTLAEADGEVARRRLAWLGV